MGNNQSTTDPTVPPCEQKLTSKREGPSIDCQSAELKTHTNSKCNAVWPHKCKFVTTFDKFLEKLISFIGLNHRAVWQAGLTLVELCLQKLGSLGSGSQQVKDGGWGAQWPEARAGQMQWANGWCHFQKNLQSRVNGARPQKQQPPM